MSGGDGASDAAVAGQGDALFVLVHAPLVGPLTWTRVAEELRRRGLRAVVPELHESEAPGQPYWVQHAEAVARAIESLPSDTRPILVGHSGAGVLLPAAARAIGRPPGAYIFVDAAIPENGKSRLDLFESRAAAGRFRRAAVEGLLPTWRDADLQDAIPDADLRRRFVAELRPLPLEVYEEPIPVFDAWPDSPCGFLRFGSNPAYDRAADEARSAGWAYAEIEGGHFHMLVDPVAVTQALLEVAGVSA